MVYIFLNVYKQCTCSAAFYTQQSRNGCFSCNQNFALLCHLACATRLLEPVSN
jgi:hypothetical protein